MTTIHTPMISVVMPVYNRERYVGAAIESILAQTYTDFEFIIVDDGSTDCSVDVIKSYHDPRIRLIQLPQNQGISAARNAGNELARGEFIAVMDSDDIALPQRLARQLEYMDSHPDIGICGASSGWVDANGNTLPEPFTATNNPKRAKVRLLFGMPFAHPTFLVRRWVYQAILYESRCVAAGDYGFLIEASRLTSIGALSEKLILVRRHPEQISQLQMERQREIDLQISIAVLMRIGVSLDQKDRETWQLFRKPPERLLSPGELQAVDELGAKILAAGLTSTEFDKTCLRNLFSGQWWYLCRKASQQGRAISALYSDSRLKWRGALSQLYEARMATLSMGIGRNIRVPRFF